MGMGVGSVGLEYRLVSQWLAIFLLDSSCWPLDPGLVFRWPLRPGSPIWPFGVPR